MNALKLTAIGGAVIAAFLVTSQFQGLRADMTMRGCGMNMGHASPLPVTAQAPNALKITASMPSPAQVGGNVLSIAVATSNGKPVSSAKVTAVVAMTSMDMGSTSPSVIDKGKGHYATTVDFSMGGPWRVTVKVIAKGHKPQTKAFDFTAG